MRLKKLKIPKAGHLLWMIFLSSCNGFNWQPHFWEFSQTGIVDSNGTEIIFSSPLLVNYSCLTKENIAELRAEIDRVKRKNNRDFDIEHYEDWAE